MTDYPLLKELVSTEFMADSGPVFARLHASNDSGVWQHPADSGIILTRYKTLKSVAKHPAFQAQNRSQRALGPGEGGVLQSLFDHHPVFLNEPEHMPVHRIAFQAIASKGAKVIIHDVTKRCDKLLDALLERESFDLVTDYCAPLAAGYWGAVLGMSEEDALQFIPWGQGLAKMLAFDASSDEREKANQDATNIWQLVERASSTRDSIAHSLNATAQAYNELGYADPGKKATALLAAMTFDAVDGAAGMLSNLVATIATKPDLQSLLRKYPESIPGAWVEASRLMPSLLGLFRCPKEDTEVEGITFEAGVNILMLNAAGNVDPLTYERPLEFDAMRKGPMPLTFGGGGRACIGRMLAKIQGEVAVERLLRRTASIEPKSDKLDWGPPGLLRTVQSVPVVVESIREVVS